MDSDISSKHHLKVVNFTFSDKCNTVTNINEDTQKEIRTLTYDSKQNDRRTTSCINGPQPKAKKIATTFVQMKYNIEGKTTKETLRKERENEPAKLVSNTYSNHQLQSFRKRDESSLLRHIINKGKVEKNASPKRTQCSKINMKLKNLQYSKYLGSSISMDENILSPSIFSDGNNAKKDKQNKQETNEIIVLYSHENNQKKSKRNFVLSHGDGPETDFDTSDSRDVSHLYPYSNRPYDVYDLSTGLQKRYTKLKKKYHSNKVSPKYPIERALSTNRIKKVQSSELMDAMHLRVVKYPDPNLITLKNQYWYTYSMPKQIKSKSSSIHSVDLDKNKNIIPTQNAPISKEDSIYQQKSSKSSSKKSIDTSRKVHFIDDHHKKYVENRPFQNCSTLNKKEKHSFIKHRTCIPKLFLLALLITAWSPCVITMILLKLITRFCRPATTYKVKHSPKLTVSERMLQTIIKYVPSSVVSLLQSEKLVKKHLKSYTFRKKDDQAFSEQNKYCSYKNNLRETETHRDALIREMFDGFINESLQKVDLGAKCLRVQDLSCKIVSQNYVTADKSHKNENLPQKKRKKDLELLRIENDTNNYKHQCRKQAKECHCDLLPQRFTKSLTPDRRQRTINTCKEKHADKLRNLTSEPEEDLTPNCCVYCRNHQINPRLYSELKLQGKDQKECILRPGKKIFLDNIGRYRTHSRLRANIIPGMLCKCQIPTQLGTHDGHRCFNNYDTDSKIYIPVQKGKGQRTITPSFSDLQKEYQLSNKSYHGQDLQIVGKEKPILNQNIVRVREREECKVSCQYEEPQIIRKCQTKLESSISTEKLQKASNQVFARWTEKFKICEKPCLEEQVRLPLKLPNVQTMDDDEIRSRIHGEREAQLKNISCPKLLPRVVPDYCRQHQKYGIYSKHPGQKVQWTNKTLEQDLERTTDRYGQDHDHEQKVELKSYADHQSSTNQTGKPSQGPILRALGDGYNEKKPLSEAHQETQRAHKERPSEKHISLFDRLHKLSAKIHTANGQKQRLGPNQEIDGTKDMRKKPAQDTTGTQKNAKLNVLSRIGNVSKQDYNKKEVGIQPKSYTDRQSQRFIDEEKFLPQSGSIQHRNRQKEYKTQTKLHIEEESQRPDIQRHETSPKMYVNQDSQWTDKRKLPSDPSIVLQGRGYGHDEVFENKTGSERKSQLTDNHRDSFEPSTQKANRKKLESLLDKLRRKMGVLVSQRKGERKSTLKKLNQPHWGRGDVSSRKHSFVEVEPSSNREHGKTNLPGKNITRKLESKIIDRAQQEKSEKERHRLNPTEDKLRLVTGDIDRSKNKTKMKKKQVSVLGNIFKKPDVPTLKHKKSKNQLLEKPIIESISGADSPNKRSIQFFGRKEKHLSSRTQNKFDGNDGWISSQGNSVKIDCDCYPDKIRQLGTGKKPFKTEASDMESTSSTRKGRKSVCECHFTKLPQLEAGKNTSKRERLNLGWQKRNEGNVYKRHEKLQNHLSKNQITQFDTNAGTRNKRTFNFFGLNKKPPASNTQIQFDVGTTSSKGKGGKSICECYFDKTRQLGTGKKPFKTGATDMESTSSTRKGRKSVCECHFTIVPQLEAGKKTSKRERLNLGWQKRKEGNVYKRHEKLQNHLSKKQITQFYTNTGTRNKRTFKSFGLNKKHPSSKTQIQFDVGTISSKGKGGKCICECHFDKTRQLGTGKKPFKTEASDMESTSSTRKGRKSVCECHFTKVPQLEAGKKTSKRERLNLGWQKRKEENVYKRHEKLQNHLSKKQITQFYTNTGTRNKRTFKSFGPNKKHPSSKTQIQFDVGSISSKGKGGKCICECYFDKTRQLGTVKKPFKTEASDMESTSSTRKGRKSVCECHFTKVPQLEASKKTSKRERLNLGWQKRKEGNVYKRHEKLQNHLSKKQITQFYTNTGTRNKRTFKSFGPNKKHPSSKTQIQFDVGSISSKGKGGKCICECYFDKTRQLGTGKKPFKTEASDMGSTSLTTKGRKGVCECHFTKVPQLEAGKKTSKRERLNLGWQKRKEGNVYKRHEKLQNHLSKKQITQYDTNAGTRNKRTFNFFGPNKKHPSSNTQIQFDVGTISSKGKGGKSICECHFDKTHQLQKGKKSSKRQALDIGSTYSTREERKSICECHFNKKPWLEGSIKFPKRKSSNVGQSSLAEKDRKSYSNKLLKSEVDKKSQKTQASKLKVKCTCESKKRKNVIVNKTGKLKQGCDCFGCTGNKKMIKIAKSCGGKCCIDLSTKQKLRARKNEVRGRSKRENVVFVSTVIQNPKGEWKKEYPHQVSQSTKCPCTNCDEKLLSSKSFYSYERQKKKNTCKCINCSRKLSTAKLSSRKRPYLGPHAKREIKGKYRCLNCRGIKQNRARRNHTNVNTRNRKAHKDGANVNCYDCFCKEKGKRMKKKKQRSHIYGKKDYCQITVPGPSCCDLFLRCWLCLVFCPLSLCCAICTNCLCKR